MSATTPIEYAFDNAGKLKSSRKLPNLKITNRPSYKPAFANTAQIMQKAYAGRTAAPVAVQKGRVPPTEKGTGQGMVGPLNQMPPRMAPIEESSSMPPPGIPGLETQGDPEGGGMVVPDAVAQDLQMGKAQPPGSESRGKKSILGGKKILIAGGIGLAAIIVIYFMFFAKGKKGKKRRKKSLY